MSELRYCPLHGEYAVHGEDTGCPACRRDPAASRRSLRQVRVLEGHELRDLSDTELTPIAERAPCPLCGTPTRLEDFRSEAIGEIWTGQAAEYAEEGVCATCFRDRVRPEIRSWSDAEWLAHHYEGWRSSLKQASEILVYETSAQEAWLPPEHRSRLLDIDKTLERRKKHLAASRSGMMELLGRHPGDVTPPPFQLTLAAETEAAIGTGAVQELRARAEADRAAEAERRMQSIADLPVSKMPESVADVSAFGREPPPPEAPRRRLLLGLLAAGVLLLLAAGLARTLLG